MVTLLRVEFGTMSWTVCASVRKDGHIDALRLILHQQLYDGSAVVMADKFCGPYPEMIHQVGHHLDVFRQTTIVVQPNRCIAESYQIGRDYPKVLRQQRHDPIQRPANGSRQRPLPVLAIPGE